MDMTMVQGPARRGFTLIEILIVVIILGILAAIAIAQFTTASQDAKLSAIQRDIQTIQEQLESYKFITNGQPSPSTFWTDLGTRVVVGGRTWGPWVSLNPANPFSGGTSVAIAPDANAPWYYDTGMNRFYGNANGTWLPQ